MKFTSSTPTPNARWLGFCLQPDCCDGKLALSVGLWYWRFMIYHPHEENN